MTVAPLGPSLTAAPGPAPASPAGAGEATATPADFLATLMAAMSIAAPTPDGGQATPPAQADPVPAEPAGTPVSTAPAELVATPGTIPAASPSVEACAEEGGQRPSRSERAPAPVPLVEEGAQAPVPKPAEPEDDVNAPGTDALPTTAPVLLDPALATLMAQAAPVAPGLEAVAAHPPHPSVREEKKVEHRATPATPATPATAGPRLAAGTEKTPAVPAIPASPSNAPRVAPHEGHAPDLAVAGMAAPTKEHASGPPEVPSSSAPVPNLPATAVQPTDAPAPAVPLQAAPAVAAAAPAAPAAQSAPSAPVANTAGLERVADQVFGQITGLVSRGNGTHRITMTLQPEQLGEVRVVMTVRDGAVHVRMAAGHEASAALLDGSTELSRLLEHAGATETRIVVRDLPAAAVAPTTPTSPHNGSLTAGHGGDAAPDQHAGTRADHQAKDGSDHHASRSARIEGPTSTGNLPRTPSVIGTRTAGVDLTM